MTRWTLKPLTFALALGGYLLLLGTIAAGFSYIKGPPPERGIIYNVIGTVTGHPESGIVYKVIGTVMVVAGIAMFGATVRRWSEYFFAFCALMAVKALFALVVGYTISQPRLIVPRTQAAEVLGVLVAMVFLSFRYADRPPRTALESISLVAAVVGLAGGIAFDPSIWPLVGGCPSAGFTPASSKTENKSDGLIIQISAERRFRATHAPKANYLGHLGRTPNSRDDSKVPKFQGFKGFGAECP